VLRQWASTVGRRIGMTKAELDQFADAFEHAERAVARRVAGLITPASLLTLPAGGP
jgi:hypothetical protein